MPLCLLYLNAHVFSTQWTRKQRLWSSNTHGIVCNPYELCGRVAHFGDELLVTNLT